MFPPVAMPCCYATTPDGYLARERLAPRLCGDSIATNFIMKRQLLQYTLHVFVDMRTISYEHTFSCLNRSAAVTAMLLAALLLPEVLLPVLFAHPTLLGCVPFAAV
jgi:hypothetical protein